MIVGYSELVGVCGQKIWIFADVDLHLDFSVFCFIMLELEYGFDAFVVGCSLCLQ